MKTGVPPFLFHGLLEQMDHLDSRLHDLDLSRQNYFRILYDLAHHAVGWNP